VQHRVWSCTSGGCPRFETADTVFWTPNFGFVSRVRRSAGSSKQFTDATTVELCLSLPSEIAVKTQIWCAVATSVLIAILDKELQLNASLYTCLQILSVSIFEKTQISCALQDTTSSPHMHCHAKQLISFDI
jgi:hypothetical protein